MKVQDKVALVTGGASGLGAATVRALLDAGAKGVVVADKAKEVGDLIIKKLSEAAKSAKAVLPAVFR